MLNFFKKKRRTITDDALGVLTFHKSTTFDESHWIVERKIGSIKELVEFSIDNTSEGINESQKKLVLAIERKYPDLVNLFEDFLNDRFREIGPDYASLSIQKDLNIHFISIPENATESGKWEINYAEKKGFAVYEIEIENWAPVGLGVSA